MKHLAAALAYWAAAALACVAVGALCASESPLATPSPVSAYINR